MMEWIINLEAADVLEANCIQVGRREDRDAGLKKHLLYLVT